MSAELLEVRETVFPPAFPPPVAGRLAPSPYSFEFTGEDALRLTVHNSVVGVRVAAHYRLKPPTGPVVANAFRLTPASDRTASMTEFAMADGYLLNVTAFAEAGSPRIGQTFVKLEVIRGRSPAGIVLGTILQDYVTAQQPIAWPGSPLRSSVEGGGTLRLITGTDPAAGVEISETVPAGARWELLTLRAPLVTGAAAGTRRPRLTIDDGTTGYVFIPSPGTVGANDTRNFYWTAGLAQDTVFDTGQNIAGLPTPLLLLAGHRIATDTSSIQAGDNYAAPIYTVREQLEAQ